MATVKRKYNDTFINYGFTSRELMSSCPNVSFVLKPSLSVIASPKILGGQNV